MGGSLVRRVVTGHDPSGKAVIVSDGAPPVVHEAPLRPGYSMSEIWATYAMPAIIDQLGEPTDRPRSLEPPRNGTVCRIVEFPPEGPWIDKIDAAKAKAAFASLGSAEAVTPMEKPPHPLMHRTKTVDYGIVLSGEIYLVLDDSETLVRARRGGPMRHEPRLEQSQRRALPSGLHPDRRGLARHAGLVRRNVSRPRTAAARGRKP